MAAATRAGRTRSDRSALQIDLQRAARAWSPRGADIKVWASAALGRRARGAGSSPCGSSPPPRVAA